MALFATYGIDLVLSGDDHVYERVEREGVTYLVIGLGGVDRHRFGSPVEGSRVRYADEYGALGLAVRADELGRLRRRRGPSHRRVRAALEGAIGTAIASVVRVFSPPCHVFTSPG